MFLKILIYVQQCLNIYGSLFVILLLTSSKLKNPVLLSHPGVSSLRACRNLPILESSLISVAPRFGGGGVTTLPPQHRNKKKHTPSPPPPRTPPPPPLCSLLHLSNPTLHLSISLSVCTFLLLTLSTIYLSLAHTIFFFNHIYACIPFPSPCLCLLELSSVNLPLSTKYLSFAHTIVFFVFSIVCPNAMGGGAAPSPPTPLQFFSWYQCMYPTLYLSISVGVY